MTNFSTAVLALASLAGMVNAQLEYLDQPVEAWTQTFEPMSEGNAVSVSPDGTTVYASSVTGKAAIIDAATGTINKIYQPAPHDSLPLGSTSGFAFGSSADLGDFVAYAVTDGGLSSLVEGFW